MKILFIALMLVLLTAPQVAAGEPKFVRPVLETAPRGFTSGGSGILPIDGLPDGYFSFLGAHFTLTSKTHITAVGGHIKGWGYQDRTMFIAIVPLGEGNTLPDVRLKDAVFAVVVEAPFNDEGPYPQPVPDTLVETHLVLPAGEYLVIIGSGLFGATGSGWMPIASSSFGTPRYIHVGFDGALREASQFFDPVRFVVEGFSVGNGNPH
jgi:hypothetical protein